MKPELRTCPACKRRKPHTSFTTTGSICRVCALAAKTDARSTPRRTALARRYDHLHVKARVNARTAPKAR